MRKLAGSDWSGNPETAPDFYEEHVRNVTDVEGVEWAMIRNHDGEVYLIPLHGWD